MDNKKIIVSLIVVGVVFWVFWIVTPANVSPELLKQNLNLENISKITGSTETESANTLFPVSFAGHPQFGNYLTDAPGMTLYVTTKTECTEKCLTVWPPYAATNEIIEQNGFLGTQFNESAGILQYTWNGQFLYYYAQDKKAGDVFGHGIGGVWSLVRQ